MDACRNISYSGRGSGVGTGALQEFRRMTVRRKIRGETGAVVGLGVFRSDLVTRVGMVNGKTVLKMVSLL